MRPGDLMGGGYKAPRRPRVQVGNPNTGGQRTATLQLHEGATLLGDARTKALPLGANVSTADYQERMFVTTPSAGTHTYSIWGLSDGTARVRDGEISVGVL